MLTSPQKSFYPQYARNNLSKIFPLQMDSSSAATLHTEARNHLSREAISCQPGAAQCHCLLGGSGSVVAGGKPGAVGSAEYPSLLGRAAHLLAAFQTTNLAMVSIWKKALVRKNGYLDRVPAQKCICSGLWLPGVLKPVAASLDGSRKTTYMKRGMIC